MKILLEGDYQSILNDKTGVRKLVKILTKVSPELIVVKPIGGVESCL